MPLKIVVFILSRIDTAYSVDMVWGTLEQSKPAKGSIIPCYLRVYPQVRISVKSRINSGKIFSPEILAGDLSTWIG